MGARLKVIQGYNFNKDLFVVRFQIGRTHVAMTSKDFLADDEEHLKSLVDSSIRGLGDSLNVRTKFMKPEYYLGSARNKVAELTGISPIVENVLGGK